MVAGWDGERLVAPSYVAAREPAPTFGPRLATEAARRGALEVERWEGSVTRRGLAILRPALVLANSAVWISNLADEYVDQRIEVSDFYHAAEHLAAVAAACFPDPTVAAARLDARKGELLTLGPLPILAAFDRLAPPTPRAAEVRASSGPTSPAASSAWTVPCCASTASRSAPVPSSRPPTTSSSAA
jgi:hypothetical protein